MLPIPPSVIARFWMHLLDLPPGFARGMGKVLCVKLHIPC